jgi:hypothetical protein
MGRSYVTLLHHPVRAKDGSIITTSITNLDVHDIARTARSFAVKKYYVVSPIAAQRALVDHITGYWRDGDGQRRVPERTEALSIVEAVDSLASVIAKVTELEGGTAPLLVTTAARGGAHATSFAEAAVKLRASSAPSLIVFGTGYGLADTVLAQADIHLAPIRPGVFNHLPVRGAVAIVLDRLFGDLGAQP